MRSSKTDQPSTNRKIAICCDSMFMPLFLIFIYLPVFQSHCNKNVIILVSSMLFFFIEIHEKMITLLKEKTQLIVWKWKVWRGWKSNNNFTSKMFLVSVVRLLFILTHLSSFRYIMPIEGSKTLNII